MIGHRGNRIAMTTKFMKRSIGAYVIDVNLGKNKRTHTHTVRKTDTNAVLERVMSLTERFSAPVATYLAQGLKDARMG